MGLMDFLKPADINAGVEEFRATPGARLIDVRTAGEYAGGHIPGAVNVPLQQIGAIASEVPDKSTPLFVYCMSGARSQQAVGALKQMGYTDARNIGGIGSWRGDSRTLGPSLGLRPPQERTATVTVKLRSWPKPRQASASQRK